MTAVPFPNRDFMQVCWVVPDLRAAIDSWVSSAGVGPFFWFDGVPFVDGRHRGRPAEFPACTAAIGCAGDLQIELVCQDNDDPGVFRDVFRRGAFGLHHMALICQDYETERTLTQQASQELRDALADLKATKAAHAATSETATLETPLVADEETAASAPTARIRAK